MAPCASLAAVGRPWPHPRRACRVSATAQPAEAPRQPTNVAAAPQRRPLPASAPSKLTFSVLFTDLDGTCVHYNSPIGVGRDGRPVEILQLPPSKTGA